MENDTINAVLVDEEAVGSVDAPGSGAKILHDDDAFNQLLHEKKSGDPMVCFSTVSTTISDPPQSFYFLFFFNPQYFSLNFFFFFFIIIFWFSLL